MPIPLSLIRLSTIAIVGLLAACDRNKDPHAVTTPVVVERRSGAVGPEYFYEETITLSGRTLTLTRTGGSSVVVGTWKVRLDGGELQRLTRACAAVDPVSDGDTVTHGPAVIGGGMWQVRIGDAAPYLEGQTHADGLHAFAPDVQALFDLVLALMADHNLDIISTASG